MPRWPRAVVDRGPRASSSACGSSPYAICPSPASSLPRPKPHDQGGATKRGERQSASATGQSDGGLGRTSSPEPWRSANRTPFWTAWDRTSNSNEQPPRPRTARKLAAFLNAGGAAGGVRHASAVGQGYVEVQPPRNRVRAPPRPRCATGSGAASRTHMHRSRLGGSGSN